MRTLSGFFLLALLASVQLAAQDQGDASLTQEKTFELALSVAAGTPPPACVSAIREAAKVAAATGKADSLQRYLSFDHDQPCAAWLILSSTQFRAAVAGSREKAAGLTEAALERAAIKQLKAMSQQNGASTGTGGGTNLTSKGLASKILSIANEYGALATSVNANTTTASGSFAGLPLLLMNKGYLVDCQLKIMAVTPCAHHGTFDYLSRIAYSVSFDTGSSATAATGTSAGSASGTAQQVKVTESSRSISAFSFKWVIKKQTPTTVDLANAHTKVDSSQQAKDFATAVQALQHAQDNASFLPWYIAHGKNLLRMAQSDPTGVAAEKYWETLGTSFAAALGITEDIKPDVAVADPTLLAAESLAKSFNAYIGLEETVGDNIVTPPIFSVEYDNNRPVSAPSNSVFRVIYQGKGKGVTFTANGAFSIYNSPQPGVPGAGRLRDSQFAAEAAHDFKVNLPGTDGPTIVTASGAFYDQYQSSPAILNVTPGSPVDGVTFVGLPSTATQVYGQKGNIAIGQFKLAVGGGSSVTVPLSVTYSNRTELIQKPTWKAQIGVSYDFDSLFGSK